MTIQLSRTFLLALGLLLFAWAGSGALAFVISTRTEDKLSDYSACERRGWNEYRVALDRYQSDARGFVEVARIEAIAKIDAAYEIYVSKHEQCADQLA